MYTIRPKNERPTFAQNMSSDLKKFYESLVELNAGLKGVVKKRDQDKSK